MKILVGCEESQTVTTELRLRGHEAYSCDIQPPSGGYPEWHLQLNIFDAIKADNWDMMIAFPPCTHIAASGRSWFKQKRADGSQQEAVEFVKKLMLAPIEKIAIENPIGILSTKIRKPDQIIQPWQFGHGYCKATCLWLQNLPLLKPTQIVEGRDLKFINNAPGKGEERRKLKSKTPKGLAVAMADQWTINRRLWIQLKFTT